MREMQVKTRFYYIPISMTKTQNINITKYWQEYGAIGILIICENEKY